MTARRENKKKRSVRQRLNDMELVPTEEVKNEPVAIGVVTTTAVYDALYVLKQTGFYGETVESVAEELLRRAVREL